ncbi:MAG: TonB-dependent copper receptor [Parvibaculaceae bacterium]|nr:TonB-dependent copper receptor [Parvibaculaceae bacterium]HBM89269.1 TonB-dependent copper receptor [Rhodobiaceae bacterium]
MTLPSKRLGRRLGGHCALIGTVALIPIIGSASASLAMGEIEALHLSEIVVRVSEGEPAIRQSFPRERLTPETDSGAYLRNTVGISAGRMGGHGVDPVIRGQQQNQINILNDGASQYGACPNRMDPPASFINMDTYDRVTVLKGYSSVLYGAGGTGGTVLFERDPVRLDRWTSKGDISVGYESNGSSKRASGIGLVGDSWGSVRADATYVDAGNYEDGDGNDVATSYRQRHGGLGLSITPTPDQFFSVDIEQDRVTDALFPGAGMDSPLSDSVKITAKGILDFDGFLSRLRFEAYGSLVDHEMDNFSLRPFTAMRARFVDSTSDTYGGRVIGDLRFDELSLSVGADLQRNEREAQRFDGPTGATANVLQNLLWPDVAITQIGVFAEGVLLLGEATGLKLGLRYDNVTSDARKADVQARVSPVGGGVFRSANNLYQIHYGTTANRTIDHNISGLARLEHDVSDLTTVFAGVSHSMRSPDATERYLSNFMGPGGVSSWVGNPNLDPERHQQIDVGFASDGGAWGLSGSLYYDRVEDYILRDRARAQAGILTNDTRTTVYRNVRATLAGGELEARHAFAPGWEGSAGVAYTYGQNETDGRALAQIPPVEVHFELRYDATDWLIGARVDMAAKATRVDADPVNGSGRDAGQTSSWATLGVFGKYLFNEVVALEGGVSNVLDADYAYHLNREDIFSGTSVQVDEPGRSAFLKISLSF